MSRAGVALLRVVVGAGGLALSVTTTINAYGLTVHSWSWLICGSLGALLLMALAQVGDDK